MPPELGCGKVLICEDPACHRTHPHWVHEYGCRWNKNAICNKDGTTTMFKDEFGKILSEPKTVKTWF